MLNKIKTLIWLRIKQLIKNKTLMMNTLLPFGFGLLYDKFFNKDGNMSLMILSITLNMSFVMATGNMVLNVISEEKEKNNMRTLLLSGVSGFEYIFSTLVVPTFIAVLSVVLMPMILNVDISGFSTQYYAVCTVNAVATIALYLLLGLISKNQSTGQVYSTFVMSLILFIPMLSQVSDGVKKVLGFTFMNSFNELFEKQATYSLSDNSFIIAVIWAVALLVVAVFFYQKGKKKTSSSSRKLIPAVKIGARA